MIGESISHYKILEKLGEGGMGVVYKAEDSRLRRTVALKFLLQELAGSHDDKLRFTREAQSASSLNHPHISHIYEIDEVGGKTFIAMEFIDGKSLRDMIDEGPLAFEDAVRIATQIADALRAAHAQGIVHRDIKPENILVTAGGDVKIADFGLSLTAEQAKASDSRQVVGTIAYMSPEQVRGGHVDAAGDVWSLGIVLYEMIGGRLPFGGEYTESMVYAILNAAHAPVSALRKDVPAGLERIIDKCLQKEPAARFGNGGEVLAELQALRTGLTGRRQGQSMAAKAIAVLPFADISPDRDNKYFSDGLTEEIIASLSKVRDLRVTSRTSVMRYDQTGKSVKEIAAELGVQYILDGSVRKHANDLRINAELIDAHQDASLWAEKYRGNLEQIFDIQEEVAAKIVDALKVKLSPDEEQSLKKRYTLDTEAYQLYLRGRFFWSTRDNEGIRNSIRYFQQAIARDPRYALAWVGMADAHSLLTEDDRVDRQEELKKAKAAVTKALELDNRLGEAHASLAILLMLNDWDWPASEKEYREAIRLDPNYATAHHWIAELLSVQGRHEDSLREISLASALDPLSAAIVKDKGMFLYYARRYDDAIAEGRRALQLDPLFWTAHRLLSLGSAAKGLYEEAFKENRLWGEGSRDQAESRVAFAYIAALAGQRGEALDVLKEFNREKIRRGNLLRGVGIVYAALEEGDEAFAWLEAAYEMRAESLINLKVDPKMDPLRGDARFADLLQRIGLA